MTDPKDPKDSNASSNASSNPDLDPIQALIASVLARVESRKAGSKASEDRKLASADLRQGEKRKRATMKQVAALGSLRDLLAAAGEGASAKHLQSVRDWLSSLAHSGAFGSADAVTLLTASAPDADPGNLLLVALACGEEPRDGDGNLVPLANHVRVIKSRPSDEVRSKDGELEAPAKERTKEIRNAGTQASRAQVAAFTSGGGDDEDLSDLDEGADDNAPESLE